MTLCTDDVLVAQYLGGDGEAFATIVRRYHHSLWWTARRHVACDYDAQDVLQEAYLRAALNLQHFRADCSLKTWLHQLVRNASHDYRTTRYRRSEVSLLDDDGIDFPHPTYDPLESLDLTLTLTTVLQRLTSDQARVLIMVDFLGNKMCSSAAHLGISLGTLKSRRWRAQSYIRSNHPELVR